MENIETIIAAIALLPILAAIGITTVAAFALMAVLGLVTEWSFKRIFFVSFFLGLIAPIIAGVSLASAVSEMMDGRDLREVITQVAPGSEQTIEQWEQIGPRVQEIEDAVERGELTQEEAREQIEQVVNEQTGLQLDLDGVVIDAGEGTLQIEGN